MVRGSKPFQEAAQNLDAWRSFPKDDAQVFADLDAEMRLVHIRGPKSVPRGEAASALPHAAGAPPSTEPAQRSVDPAQPVLAADPAQPHIYNLSPAEMQPASQNAAPRDAGLQDTWLQDAASVAHISAPNPSGSNAAAAPNAQGALRGNTSPGEERERPASGDVSTAPQHEAAPDRRRGQAMQPQSPAQEQSPQSTNGQGTPSGPGFAHAASAHPPQGEAVEEVVELHAGLELPRDTICLSVELHRLWLRRSTPLALRQGGILPLAESLRQGTVQLTLDGRPVAQGQMVRLQGGRMGVRVLRVG